MPSRTRRTLLTLVALGTMVGCQAPHSAPPALGRAGSGPAPVATFEGRFDPATGALTIRTTSAAEAASRVGRTAYQPYQDGAPGSGPVDTFELVTDATPAPGVTADGCGTGVASFDGHITLRSFHRTLSFADVAIELTEVTTGHEACNSATPAYGGMSNALGLWDYGALGVQGSLSAPLDAGTVLWRFRFATSEAFTFRGRIMAQADPVPAPANGATSFEWAPFMFADPPHSFQDVVTTKSHVVWNGSAFVDTKGVAAFSRVGAAVPTTTVGIAYPALSYVGPWPADGAGRYEATPTTAALDTSGDFTVCAKFKPGVNPGAMERKVLVAKGNPIGQTNLGYLSTDLGWALTQQHGPAVGGGPQYAFFYRTGDAADVSATDSFVFPGDNPENSAFDYVCGGRVSTGCVITGEPAYAGSCIRVMAHGRDIHFDTKVTGSFGDHIADMASLPLVVGSAAGGVWPALDEGVYEVIIDSRPATLATMTEIVDAAEGRRTYNGAAYLGNDVDATPVPGVDGVTYGFPLGSTAPVTSDATGLMTAGTLLRFTSLLASSPGAYCIGAEVTSPDWPNAVGGILGDENGILRLFIPSSDHVLTGFNGSWPAWGPDVRLQGWPANSRHTFKVCATSGGSVDLHIDGTLAASRSPAGTLLDVTSAAAQVHVGEGYVDVFSLGLVPLTGARVGRVFACPTSVAASCN